MDQPDQPPVMARFAAPQVKVEGSGKQGHMTVAPHRGQGWVEHAEHFSKCEGADFGRFGHQSGRLVFVGVCLSLSE